MELQPFRPFPRLLSGRTQSARSSSLSFPTVFFLLLSIVASACLAGCSGASGSATGPDKTGSMGSAAPANESSPDNGASFSYSMDGMTFSGKGTDQFANCAYRSEDGGVNFVLMDITPGQKGIPTQIHIFGPAQGTANFPSSANAKCSADMRYADKDGNQPHSYTPVSLTMTILSNSATRISGTFSGTFDVTGENRMVPLTDGKFDIPYSSYSPKQK